jgi:hypothetical protein
MKITERSVTDHVCDLCSLNNSEGASAALAFTRSQSGSPQKRVHPVIFQLNDNSFDQIISKLNAKPNKNFITDEFSQ